MPFPFAHSNGADTQFWQPLSDHSEGVAKLASSFARPFRSEAHARLLGEFHDLGKARKSFQSYLLRCNGIEEPSPDCEDRSHSGAGACWLAGNAGKLGRALAYCVAGHHAGLPDWSGGETPSGALASRLVNDASVLTEPSVRDWVAGCERKQLPNPLAPPFRFSRDDSSLSFWIRMLFSCLVDADFLDTEAFMDSAKSACRTFGKPLDELAPVFFSHLDGKQRAARDTSVNRVRAEIRSACEDAARLEPGLFSLTVPTGGGKTLSGTAFAFKHALTHGLKRIIYVIPYTSIIEQTADVLRGILGEENVLEHHSNFDPDKETLRSRLASENWDAPVVVTTAVQFFESLHACNPSRCRKLHNISESVVILDEVQLLPTKLLLPCAEAVRQLVSHYRTSVVLSTATQLDLPGIDPASVREIVPASLDLYHRLKRVRIEFPDPRSPRRTWEDLADELSRLDSVLCVVNTRRDCRALFDRMPVGTIHLSAAMCGAHRSRIISEIKARLARSESVRVVSTQLVEAGVDVDFPVVYRAFTGLASVAQSAGRCNREGTLAEPGRVVVFLPPEPSPRGELLQGEYALSDLLDRPGGVDPDEARSFPDYFRALHARVQDLGRSFERTLGVPVPAEFRNGAPKNAAPPMEYQFREAAAAFQMIDGEVSVPVIVRYGDADRWIAALRAAGPTRAAMRRLQRFSVNVPRRRLGELLESGSVEELRVPPHPDEPSGIFVQTDPSAYSDVFGLDLFRGDAPANDKTT